MKKSLIYIAAALMSVFGLSSCGDPFERPPMVVPVATVQANTTLLELKTAYWKSDRNYVSTVGLTLQGEHTVVKGRVISSDATGNVYKNVVISDGTAALAISVNAYDLYKSYQFGQEIVVDVTGMKLGGYNGLMQLGGEGVYNGAPSMTFMESTVFAAAAQPNGLADTRLVDTLATTIADVNAMKSNQDSLIRWQSRLVKFENVAWAEAGQAYAPGGANTNRYLIDADGNRLLVRNSGYATFKDELMPKGSGTVAGILSYYGSDWQFVLIDAQASIDFDPNKIIGPVFSESFAGSSLGQFTLDYVTKPEGFAANVWLGTANYGAVATAFDKATFTNYASDCRLVSPVIDLGSLESPKLAFEHAVNYFSSLDEAKTSVWVEVRPEGGQWTKLDGLAFPDALSFTFVPSGNMDLSAYRGKKIQFAFRYTSTAVKAGTWEVKNAVVK